MPCEKNVVDRFERVAGVDRDPEPIPSVEVLDRRHYLILNVDANVDSVVFKKVLQDRITGIEHGRYTSRTAQRRLILSAAIRSDSGIGLSQRGIIIGDSKTGGILPNVFSEEAVNDGHRMIHGVGNNQIRSD